jgi:hypothetical protein
MRWLVGLVLALALVASPSDANAAHTEKECGEPSHWLRLELDSADLRLTSNEMQLFALIPQHLEEHIPGHRKKQSDEREVRSEFELDYLAVEQEEAKRHRGRAIALGITIPIIIFGVSCGIAAAVIVRNFEF